MCIGKITVIIPQAQVHCCVAFLNDGQKQQGVRIIIITLVKIKLLVNGLVMCEILLMRFLQIITSGECEVLLNIVDLKHSVKHSLWFQTDRIFGPNRTKYSDGQ